MKKILPALETIIVILLACSHMVTAQWVQTNGPVQSTVFSLAARDTILFAGTYNGVYQSTNAGATWSTGGPGMGHRVFSLAIMGTMVFAGTDNGVYRSSNNGTSWDAVDTGIPGTTIVHALAVSGNNILAGALTQGVFLSRDSGLTWTAVDSGLPAITTSVYSLAVNNGRCFAGTYTAGVYVSANNGTNWTAYNGGLPGSAVNSYVLSLAVCGSDLFAGIGNSIYALMAGGATWSPAGSGLMQSTLYALAASGTNLFAGTYSEGVFLSEDNGGTWIPESAGLPQGNQNMCLMASGANLFLGSGNHGVWRRPLSEMVGVIDRKLQRRIDGPIAFEVALPSPTHRYVAVRFSLPHPEHATIKIYSLSGSELGTLADGNLGSGPHEFLWDIRNAAAGCYAIRLQAGPNGLSKSLPIVR